MSLRLHTTAGYSPEACHHQPQKQPRGHSIPYSSFQQGLTSKQPPLPMPPPIPTLPTKYVLQLRPIPICSINPSTHLRSTMIHCSPPHVLLQCIKVCFDILQAPLPTGPFPSPAYFPFFTRFSNAPSLSSPVSTTSSCQPTCSMNASTHLRSTMVTLFSTARIRDKRAELAAPCSEGLLQTTGRTTDWK